MAEPVHDYSWSNPPYEVTPGQWLALIIGVAFVAAGIAGFVVTGRQGFASDVGKDLAGFGVNPLHNIVHLAIGIPGLIVWRRVGLTRLYGGALAVIYGAAFVYGVIAVNKSWDFLALNWADNWLHLVTAGLGIAVVALTASREYRAGGPTDAAETAAA